MTPERASRLRRIAFTSWAALVVVAFGIAFFGFTVLLIGWFEDLEGVAGPVTELGYGALIGILLTLGVASQLRHPERKIAGLQQAALVGPALLIGSALSSDAQNLEPVLILIPALGVLIVLHPARGEFLRPPIHLNKTLLALALLTAIPLTAYALAMGAAAQDLVGPPHHVQRLSIQAALAAGIVLTAMLAAFQTPGWEIPARSAAAAVIVFGLASIIFPDHPAAVGTGWGIVAIAGGLLFVAVAEWQRARSSPVPT